MEDIRSKLNRPYSGPKFNVGDKIICINNEVLEFTYGNSSWNDSWKNDIPLEIGKIYIVSGFDLKSNRPKVYIDIDNGWNWFYPERFISIATQRKKKLLKLNENLLIKENL